ncbi:TPA: proteasome subunit alpha [Candidatus Latescibacteria bacterium]|nr:proteasome subunit alpha [Candidatus Latescibacterota bacterium]
MSDHASNGLDFGALPQLGPGADFFDLLKAGGYHFPGQVVAEATAPGGPAFQPTEGTTILALRYGQGVLIAGDRRATAGNAVIYDRADKVLPIDDRSVMAISGSPAMAYEIARILEHSFQYHRRRQLTEMSIEAKLRRLSILIRDNLPMAIQGIGAVIPIFATYDNKDETGKIFFYDALGAQFEVTDFTTTGSGSSAIRGVMYHLNRWGQTPFANLPRDEAIGLSLRLLFTASEYDSATGRYEQTADVFPTVKTVTADGLSDVSVDELRGLHARFIEAG